MTKMLQTELNLQKKRPIDSIAAGSGLLDDRRHPQCTTPVPWAAKDTIFGAQLPERPATSWGIANLREWAVTMLHATATP